MSRSFPTASHSFRARPGPRSLATTNGVSIDVLSSGYLDVSVPRVCFKPLFYSGFDTCFQNSNMKPPKRPHNIEFCQVGFPIRKSTDQRVLAPPRSLSQRATSFIASERQGIHRIPFSRLIRSRSRKTLWSALCASGLRLIGHQPQQSILNDPSTLAPRIVPLIIHQDLRTPILRDMPAGVFLLSLHDVNQRLKLPCESLNGLTNI